MAEFLLTLLKIVKWVIASISLLAFFTATGYKAFPLMESLLRPYQKLLKAFAILVIYFFYTGCPA